MTIGAFMYYGGMAGVAVGLILLVVLTRVFAGQRKRMKDEFNQKETKVMIKNK